jgi:large subunit ribosomal protein L15
MKLHDLRPAPGSRTERTRVGRGIAAGKGKTAGRGTKGQKARAGASIPGWFEGGQTPIHMRVPKLRGFKQRGRIDYEIVNVGDISRAADAGRLAGHDPEEPAAGSRTKKSTAPLTVNADTLAVAGLIRRTRYPVKVLGEGEVKQALFVVADAFTRSAREKIEAAGGTAQLLQVPEESRPALGREETPKGERAGKPPAGGRKGAKATDEPAADEPATDEPTTDEPATADAAPEAALPSDGDEPASADVSVAAESAEGADQPSDTERG